LDIDIGHGAGHSNWVSDNIFLHGCNSLPTTPEGDSGRLMLNIRGLFIEVSSELGTLLVACEFRPGFRPQRVMCELGPLLPSANLMASFNRAAPFFFFSF